MRRPRWGLRATRSRPAPPRCRWARSRWGCRSERQGWGWTQILQKGVRRPGRGSSVIGRRTGRGAGRGDTAAGRTGRAPASDARPARVAEDQRVIGIERGTVSTLPLGAAPAGGRHHLPRGSTGTAIGGAARRGVASSDGRSDRRTRPARPPTRASIRRSQQARAAATGDAARSTVVPPRCDRRHGDGVAGALGGVAPRGPRDAVRGVGGRVGIGRRRGVRRPIRLLRRARRSRAADAALRDVVAWRTVHRVPRQQVVTVRVRAGAWRWFELELDDGSLGDARRGVPGAVPGPPGAGRAPPRPGGPGPAPRRRRRLSRRACVPPGRGQDRAAAVRRTPMRASLEPMSDAPPPRRRHPRVEVATHTQLGAATDGDAVARAVRPLPGVSGAAPVPSLVHDGRPLSTLRPALRADRGALDRRHRREHRLRDGADVDRPGRRDVRLVPRPTADRAAAGRGDRDRGRRSPGVLPGVAHPVVGDGPADAPRWHRERSTRVSSSWTRSGTAPRPREARRPPRQATRAGRSASRARPPTHPGPARSARPAPAAGGAPGRRPPPEHRTIVRRHGWGFSPAARSCAPRAGVRSVALGSHRCEPAGGSRCRPVGCG